MEVVVIILMVIGPLALILTAAIQVYRGLRAVAEGLGREMVEKWAAEGRNKIVELRTCGLWERALGQPRGTSQVQILFRCILQEKDGLLMDGWARCGGRLLGPLVDRVEFFPIAWGMNIGVYDEE
jgi:hypothetical protein